MREPMSQLLAGDGNVAKKYPFVSTGKGTKTQWMEFARDRQTDNFALRVLGGQGCCDGNNTDPVYLENAKELLSRFTYVVDLACLNEGLQEMFDQLGFDVTIVDPNAKNEVKRHHHAPPSERIPYPEVYDYLLEKNKLSSELYEWSKSISLVDCAALSDADEE